MAKQIQKPKSSITTSGKAGSKLAKKAVTWEFPLEKKNLMWILIGIGVVILGYILMSTGITSEAAVPDGKWNNPIAIGVAPVLLVIGYCVIIPYGILKMFKSKPDKE